MALKLVGTITRKFEGLTKIVKHAGKSVLYKETLTPDSGIVTIHHPDETVGFMLKYAIMDNEITIEIWIDISVPNIELYVSEFTFYGLLETELFKALYPSKSIFELGGHDYVIVDNVYEHKVIDNLLKINEFKPVEYPVLLGVEYTETWTNGEFSNHKVDDVIEILKRHIVFLRNTY